MKVCFISLGCDKNTVDSEKIFDFFNKKYKCDIVVEPERADIVLINTCAFIKDAKKESIDYIKYLVTLKRRGIVKKILAFGCLVAENAKTNEYDDIFKDVDVTLDINKYLEGLNNVNDRMTDVLSFSSFIKICDGCDKFCTYCIIPYLRGRFKSNSYKNIIEETKKLAKSGVKELNVVGQDILSYGKDISNSSEFNIKKEKPIVTLLRDMSKVSGIKWIRLLYCYPEEISDDLISLLKDNKKIIPYIDMPIQHSSDKILKLMNRKTTKEEIINIISKLRNNIKDICIRTTLIVGFPGETNDDFNDLKQFVKDIRFDKLGVFTYSREKLSKSYNFEGQVFEEVKEKRKKELMDIQKEIVKEKNNEKLGKVYEAIVEGRISNKKDVYLVRPYFNARDIDDKVFVKSNTLLISGSFVNVMINKVDGYDLEGVVV
ncbi:MAG: 30S ribosomal protein S12 methylthiotransferase RimO [Lachnospiraceae bacterium]|nr:30S ribosomal protein S12 methylthiotransferase RimO [Lachnospiraceae bacterium]